MAADLQGSVTAVSTLVARHRHQKGTRYDRAELLKVTSHFIALDVPTLRAIVNKWGSGSLPMPSNTSTDTGCDTACGTDDEVKQVYAKVLRV